LAVKRGAAPGAKEAPAVVMEDVDGAFVQGCRPLPGRFLHVGGRSRAIHLVGNDFSATDVPVSYASETLQGAVALEGNLPPR
jgi:hypothetical protein